jgi:hypothetical protein
MTSTHHFDSSKFYRNLKTKPSEATNAAEHNTFDVSLINVMGKYK